MRLIIERAKWLRGEGDRRSKLLRPSDGKMCCLGMFALACGYPEDAISNVAAPHCMSNTGLFPRGVIESNRYESAAAVRLMMDNDDQDIDDAQREQRIASGFARLGVEVEFK